GRYRRQGCGGLQQARRAGQGSKGQDGQGQGRQAQGRVTQDMTGGKNGPESERTPGRCAFERCATRSKIPAPPSATSPADPQSSCAPHWAESPTLSRQ